MIALQRSSMPVWPASSYSYVAVAALVVLCIGCSTEDAQLVSLRQRLLLPREPDGATTIASAKAALDKNPEVVFVGQIVGDEHDAFVPGQAAFVVTEAALEEHGHGGRNHVDTCPFCKRRAAQAPRAAVRFVDNAGQTLRVDARKLFQLRPGDTVVVQGAGKLLPPIGTFQVEARAIYVRRQGDEP